MKESRIPRNTIWGSTLAPGQRQPAVPGQGTYVITQLSHPMKRNDGYTLIEKPTQSHFPAPNLAVWPPLTGVLLVALESLRRKLEIASVLRNDPDHVFRNAS